MDKEKLEREEFNSQAIVETSKDLATFNGIGEVVGFGRLGTLQRMMGIEAAQPIIDRLNKMQRAQNRTLGRIGMGRYARPVH